MYVLLDSGSALTSISEALVAKRQQDINDWPIIGYKRGKCALGISFGNIYTVERQSIPI